MAESSPFIIREHLVPGQHIREYARATSTSQSDVLKVAVKEYVPRENLEPREGDITVIGAHANGFPKELYEPLWEDLVIEAKKQGLRIRAIWIADCAWQGQSGIANQGVLGNDPSWFDHARDLLLIINHFRTQMPPPLVGIGHSFGGSILTHLSLMHPRLLTSLVLLDPVISGFASTPGSLTNSPAGLSLYRRDVWPSREEASSSFAKSPYYAAWDPRVLSRWVKFGLRDLPTDTYPDAKPPGVTLTTTKHQEVFTFLRPSWPAYDKEGRTLLKKDLVPDLDPKSMFQIFPFYRPETSLTLARLPYLRPSVLWINGTASAVSHPDIRRERLATAGIGAGGSGGVDSGRVREVALEGKGHLFPLEIPGKCARLAVDWLVPEMRRWALEDLEFREWARKSDAEKTLLGEEWMERIPRAERAKKQDRSKL